MATQQEMKEMIQRLLAQQSGAIQAQQKQEKFDASIANGAGTAPPGGGGGNDPLHGDEMYLKGRLDSPSAMDMLRASYAAQSGQTGITNNTPVDSNARAMLAGLARQGQNLSNEANKGNGQVGVSSASGGFSDLNQIGHDKQRAYQQQQIQDMMQRLGVDQAKQSMSLADRGMTLQEKSQADEYGLAKDAESRRRGIIEGIFPYIGLLMQRLK